MYLRSPRPSGGWEVGDNLVFYAQAIDTAGSFDDAAVGPTYDVYVNENPVAVVAAAPMALLGAVGSGLYSETLALAGPAFAVGNRYVIRITATVDGEDPAALWVFDVVAADEIADAVADQVWDEDKADHQGATIFGNIAQDTDDLEFTMEEG